MSITIQPITTIDEARAVESLTQTVWNSSDLAAIPDHLIITIAKEKGQVLLARDDNGQPVGFTLGFLSQNDDGILKLASHQAGVIAHRRGRGYGYQLKCAQRAESLKQGIKLITWTYDPLQRHNAWLNIRKLGGISHTYLKNIYGEMRDAINAGMPTDRFRIHWWLDSPHVTQRVDASPPDFPFPNLPVVTLDNLSALIGQTPRLLVELPANINQLKQTDLSAARAWSDRFGQIFPALFVAGYAIKNLHTHNGRWFYEVAVREE